MSSRRGLAAYLSDRLVGTLGIQVQSVAVGWQVYSTTGDPIDLGWVGLAQFLPLALLSPYGGGIADRFDRRRILLVCRVLYALGALCLAGLSRHPEWGVGPIYGVLAGLGALRAFASPASVAMLPSLVDASRLSRAIAMSSTTFQVGTIAGPALGGLLYALGGATVAYLVSAALGLGAAVALSVMPYRALPREAPPERGWALLSSGVRYVFRERVLLGAISLDLFAVLLGGAVALLPVIAQEVLHVGEVEFGLLRAAPALGAAVVAIVLSVRPMKRHAGRWMFAGVAVFGVATVVFGLSTNLWLSLAALAVTGAADMISVVVRQSLVQLRTPDAWRGRVASVNMVFIGASNELGELESGLTAAWLGTVRAVVLGGIGTLLVTGVYAALFPEIRDVDRLEDEAVEA
ncbi:MAG: MFS transporter [Sandaracinaceae bacterium]